MTDVPEKREHPRVVQAVGVAVRPVPEGTTPPVPLDAVAVCNALAQWAEAASIEREGKPGGRLYVVKSDLLHRLIYGGEAGPSQTPCPVHKGKWSGCHYGWPSDEWHMADGTVKPMEISTGLQRWYDEGCRCFMHRGSSCTTGWQPDKNCGCSDD